MGRRQPLLGDAGEAHALGFLKDSFSDHAKTQSGAAVDWICRGLLDGRKSPSSFRTPTLEFNVQVKTQERFNVSRTTFRQWLLLNETQPVILLVVLEVTAAQQEYWYVPLHDWLLTSRGQIALTTDQPLAFAIQKDFHHSDDGGLIFHDALKAEADRALRASSSPWATLRDYGLLPFDEALFFEYLEFAPHAEIPVDVSRRVASKVSAPEALRALLLAGEVDDPQVAQWLHRMKDLAAQQSSKGFQRRQFARFTRAMSQYRRGRRVPRLPTFTIGEVSAWRAFVAMYPHALAMLKLIITHSARASDVIFGRVDAAGSGQFR